MFEEVGIIAEPVAASSLSRPAVTFHPLPFLNVEVDVGDPDHGLHWHIDVLYVLYVLRAARGHLKAALDEVGGARWVSLADRSAGAAFDPVSQLTQMAYRYRV